MSTGNPNVKQAEAERENGLRTMPFSHALAKHGLTLKRDKAHTLQVNVGFLCNQACVHCHLDAGPGRTENMSAETVDQVAEYARRGRFETIDITGGAPELNPNIMDMVEKFSRLAPRIMLRSNLSALNIRKRDALIDLLKDRRAVIVASFPAINSKQTDAQRGDGIFQISLDLLKKLNTLGYGRRDSGLELNLVSNPVGAFLPPSQTHAEKRFRLALKNKYQIEFNSLYNFANVPLGRFAQWLVKTGNYNQYLKKLASSFNPCAIEGVMCRGLISVSWDGYLFDCDFNLAAGLYMGRRKMHVIRMSGLPPVGTPIATADHCYTCTAGAGFT